MEKKERFDLSEGDDFNLFSLHKLLNITNYPKESNHIFEPFNVVAEVGDSIYTIPINECIGGQVYISEDKVRDIINEELDKRLGSSLKNNNHRNE